MGSTIRKTTEAPERTSDEGLDNCSGVVIQGA